MEGTALHDPRTRRGWIWLIVAGFAVSVAGIIAGLQKAGPLCGSPLIPQSRQAEIFDALRSGSRVAGECYRRIDAAAAPTWMLIAAGFLPALLTLAGGGLWMLADVFLIPGLHRQANRRSRELATAYAFA